MCNRLKSGGRYIVPGNIVEYLRSNGEKSIGPWGLMGFAHNVRLDKLDTTWNTLRSNRGILEVDSFLEMGREFKTGEKIELAVIYEPQTWTFGVITTESNSVVARIHHRMPLALSDTGLWLSTGKVVPERKELIMV